MVVIVAVTDLMFESKIIGVAAQVRGDIVLAKTQNAALEQAEVLNPTRVLIDLNEKAYDALDTIKKLKEKNKELEIIGFVSHVQRDLIAKAKVIGCDRVLARSAFFAKLPEFLTE
jgi:DNA-binding NarL/FixJ family response regulator